MDKKLKIRQNIFETNSSSTHCVSFNRWIPGRSGRLDPEPDGKIHVYGGEFGWEWRAYNDSETKVDYYFTFFKGNPRMTQLGIKVIKEWTGRDVVVDIYDGSYIDHQSSDTLDFLENDTESADGIRDFFFNPDTWLYTGNDNDDTPNDLRYQEKSELLKSGEVWTIKIGYTLSDGREVVKEHKLSGYPDEEILRRDLNDHDYDIQDCNMEKGILALRVFDRETYSYEDVEAKIVSIESEKYGKIL